MQVVTKDGTSAGLRCGYVVNGGGPWAADIASLAGTVLSHLDWESHLANVGYFPGLHV